MSENKNILKKLHKVMSEIEAIGKTGRNKFHNYDYATEADVLQAVRQKLIDNKLMIIPSAGECFIHTHGDMFLTDIEMGYTIWDVESGESIKTTWRGQGTDKGDKGLYKAFTGGHKYFLMKTFFLPTDADPENDSRDSFPQAPPQTDTALATEKQKTRLGVLVAEKDVEYGLSCEIDDKIRRGVLTLGEAKEYADQLKKMPKLEDSRVTK